MLVAGAAAPTGAAAQAPPDERAAAREFSYAAYRLRLAIKAQHVTLERQLTGRVDALLRPRCRRALDVIPERRESDVIFVASIAATVPAYLTVRPSFERFLAEIEAVPTADPALRSGRASWRGPVGLMRRLRPLPDLCAALEAWRRAGFAPDAAPVDVGDTRDFDLGSQMAQNAKAERAERRMRRLGVGKSAARRFTGETLFIGVGDGLGS